MPRSPIRRVLRSEKMPMSTRTYRHQLECGHTRYIKGRKLRVVACHACKREGVIHA